MDALLPESLSAIDASILIVASFFTSGFTAAAGVGGGMAMLVLMSYFLPVSAIIPVHGMVQFGSNSGRAIIQHEHINYPLTSIFAIGAIFGALIGAMLVIQVPEAIFKTILGVFIFVMVWIKIPRLQNPSNIATALGGTITSVLTMFVGATGPLVALFLQKALPDHKSRVATLGAAMTVQHGFKILAFALAGFIFTEWLPLIAMMILTGVMGTKSGTMLLNRLPEKYLVLAFKIILSIAGLDLIRRGMAPI